MEELIKLFGDYLGDSDPYGYLDMVSEWKWSHYDFDEEDIDDEYVAHEALKDSLITCGKETMLEWLGSELDSYDGDERYSKEIATVNLLIEKVNEYWNESQL